jgi:hypothetical protein
LLGLYDEKEVDQQRRRLESGVDGDLYEAIGVALCYLKPPTQQLEFLAKTLTMGKSYGLEHMTGHMETTIILGTPIYVQQTHPLPDEQFLGLDDEWKEHLTQRK